VLGIRVWGMFGAAASSVGGACGAADFTSAYQRSTSGIEFGRCRPSGGFRHIGDQGDCNILAMVPHLTAISGINERAPALV